MWMSSEDARSDFVLAAAAFLLGSLVQELVQRLPGYPGAGSTLGSSLGIAWLFVLTGMVPLLLARYRHHGLGAFGLTTERTGLAQGLVIALPIAGVGILDRWTGGETLGNALIGELDLLRAPFNVERVVLGASTLVAIFVGVLLLYTFLTVRARDGFRRNVISLVEALRTFGMGAVGAALVLGLIHAARPEFRLAGVLWTVGGLAAAVLLTDRVLVPGMETTRSTILAPAIVAAASALLAGGGLFGNRDLPFSLYRGALAAAMVIVMATLVETRVRAWGVVPIVLAATVYITFATPL